MNKAQSVKWACNRFEELTAGWLYRILKLRQEVFIIEQNCIYSDIDEYDCLSLHLIAYNEPNELIGYCRLIPAGLLFQEVSIGRVVISKHFRRKGLARQLMLQAQKFCCSEYKSQSIRLNAQQYLEKFYQSLGYHRISEPYDEDGVIHIQMLKKS